VLRARHHPEHPQVPADTGPLIIVAGQDRGPGEGGGRAVVSHKTPASWAARLPVSPAVLWTGIAVGVLLAVEAMVHGVFLPLSLGLLADAILTFLLIVALAVVLAELTRRHHRTVAGHAARRGRRAIGYGRRQSAAGARLAGRHGRTVLAWLAAKAGPRWERRFRKPALFRRLRDEPEGPAAEGQPEEAAGPAWSFGHAGQRAAWPVPSLEEATARARQMSADGEPYVVTEYPPGGGPGRTVATYVHGKPSTETTEGSTTMPPSRISTGHRAQRAARTGAAAIPSEWAAVVGQTADFEPDSDAELLDWMARQVTGLSAWAEALVDTYEHATQVIGIDPKASAMLHDVADAAAQAAETMGAAKAKFAEHYELPREFAANGGLMTHDGRWITGEGA
jgi:hypothetical protein